MSCATNTFPANVHCTDALVLSLETSDDDEDFAQYACARRDRHLPAQYCTSDFVPTSCTAAHSQLLTSNPAPSNIKDTNNALQQQGISTIAREGAQPQATANPNTPNNLEDYLAAESDATAADNDDDGREERNKDAGSNVRSPLYTNFDKLARASSNNSNSYQMAGNNQDACDSHALSSHCEYSAINSNTDTSRCCSNNNYNSNSNSNTINTTGIISTNANSSSSDSILNTNAFHDSSSGSSSSFTHATNIFNVACMLDTNTVTSSNSNMDSADATNSNTSGSNSNATGIVNTTPMPSTNATSSTAAPTMPAVSSPPHAPPPLANASIPSTAEAQTLSHAWTLGPTVVPSIQCSTKFERDDV